jgi:ribA/ribD-fused uncharacterized protein
MPKHANIENGEITVPYYAIHADGKICGFFGLFRFLSNFYVLENGICLDEIYYPSVEHAYQAAKWPVDQRKKFLDMEAWRAKKYGKLAPGFNRKQWDKKKVGLMNGLCRQKFDKNDKLRKMLMMTEDALLEERNAWGDRFWGTDVDGVGENTLGRILMNIRDDYKLIEKGDLF